MKKNKSQQTVDAYLSKVAKKRGMTLDEFHAKIIEDMYNNMDSRIADFEREHSVPFYATKCILSAMPLYIFDTTTPITFNFNYEQD